MKREILEQRYHTLFKLSRFSIRLTVTLADHQ